MPKVSVVIPVFGVEKFIERCARSLFEQTLDDIEYIFVDDCSTDRSVEILKCIIEEYRPRFAGENKSVRIESMPTNSGMAAVRRHGMQFSTGEYIIHCDSDDWIEPNMYEVLYTEAKRGNYDIVMCDFCLSDGINLIKNCESNCSEDKLVLLGSLLSGKVHGSLCTKLARSSLYNEDFIYPEDNMREDLCCVIQLVYNANSVKYLPIPMYHYFINEASICNVVTFDQVYKKYKQSCNNSNKIFTFLQNNNLMDKYKKELIVLKLCIKEELCKIAKGEKGRKVWKEAFPEVGIINTLFSAIPFRMKLKILLTNCRLYPLLIYVL